MKEDIKDLIDSYERKIISIQELINRNVVNDVSLTRFTIKLHCYMTFLTELEKILKET